MAAYGTFFRLCNVVGNYRNFLSARTSLPTYQRCMSKQTLQDKLGLPPRPKKPLSPFFRFMQERRPVWTKENPNFKITEITKLASKEWEHIDPVKKAKLEQDYEKEQVNYTKERLNYDQSLTSEQKDLIKKAKEDANEQKEKLKHRKKNQELGKPKRPITPYLQFFKEKLSSRGTMDFRVWQKQIGEQWKELPEENKRKYLSMMHKESENYKKAMKSWEEKMIRLGHIDLVRVQKPKRAKE